MHLESMSRTFRKPLSRVASVLMLLGMAAAALTPALPASPTN